jgi:hypothetical protein
LDIDFGDRYGSASLGKPHELVLKIVPEKIAVPRARWREGG